MATIHSDVDAIVIGSGAGGLTTALCLAQSGMKVLVLEQHDTPGGWCHSFTLDQYRFSPGVHYLGEMHEGGRFRRIYEGLGVANDMTMLELNPDGFDHIVVGGSRFDIPKGKEAYRRRLMETFPADAEGLSKYIDIVYEMSREMGAMLSLKPRDLPLLPLKMKTLIRWGLGRTVANVLHTHVKDPMARAVLTAQVGDSGLPPERIPAPLHFGVMDHYFGGAWYPKGGGFTIPRAFLRALKRHGGEIRLETRVDRILLERRGRKKTAVGVRLADGTEIRAKHVISNADPGVTLGQLMDSSDLSWRLRRRLARTKWSISCLSLFMGVEMDDDEIAAAKLDSGNVWYSRTTDIGAAYRVAESDALGKVLADIPAVFLTATSLKDRTKKKGNRHTMESFAFVSWEAFRKWAHTHYGSRPEDYEVMKRDLTGRMLKTIEEFVPGFSDKVVFSDLGTPLTNWHYCRSTGGGLYGTEKSWMQVGPFAYPLATEFDGLTLCGDSTISHGVMGATMSGLQAAKQILGCGMRELLSHGEGQHLQCYPADDTSRWPDKMQRTLARQAKKIA